MLIVINTWKRPEILRTTLGAVLANKHCTSSVGLVDDCTPDWSPPFSVDNVWQAPEHLGVAMARRYALECCLTTDHDLFMLMDNDMLVKPGFDVDGMDVWLTHRHKHKNCLGSPYRSHSAHREREIDFGGYLFGTSNAGAMLYFDRRMVEHVLNTMVPWLWNVWWDWTLSGFVNGFIKPKADYATHIGHDADALHPVHPED